MLVKLAHNLLASVLMFLLGPNCWAQLRVDQFAGTDIGAKANTCIAQFSPTSPGLCALSTNTTYALTTTIVKPQWVTIEGNNAVITVSSLSTPAIVAATTTSLAPNEAGAYSRRGISNLTLIGNGPSSTPYGIWLGGDPTNTFISSTATDFLEQFDNLHVQNFGSQYAIGTNAFQDTWIGGTVMGGYNSAENGVTMVTNATGAENMTFVGTMFESGGGNTGYALNVPNGYGSTFNFIGTSIDYWGAKNYNPPQGYVCSSSIAGNGQILFNNGHLTLTTVHMQTCPEPEIVSTNGSYQTIINVGGGAEFTLDNPPSPITVPALIEVSGGSPQVYVAEGSIVGVGTNVTLQAFVSNSGTGGQFWIGPYFSVKGGYSQVPPRSGAWNSGLEPIYVNGSIYGFKIVGNDGLTTTGNVQTSGIACGPSNIALGTGWGTSASTSSFSGYSQTCQFTITTGTGGFASAPALTFTFPIAFATTPVCTLDVHAISGSGGAIMFSNTTPSATAPVFTATSSTGSSFTPAAGETYKVVLRCGP